MAAEGNRYIVFDNASRSPLGQIKMCGILKRSTGVPKLRLLGYYALVYVTGGHGFFRDSTGFSCLLRPGDLIVLFPEVEHVYGPLDDTPWDETFVVFEGEAFDLWREGGLLSAARPLYRLEPVEHWHRRIVAAVWTDPGAGTDVALSRICRLQGLLAEIVTFERRQSAAATDWLTEASALLRETATAAPAYEKIAEALGMTYEGFRKRFAREAGISPGRYHAQVRIQRACELLLGEQVTLREVGLELGFFDEFHFSKSFKRAVGVTPREFRRYFGAKPVANQDVDNPPGQVEL